MSEGGSEAVVKTWEVVGFELWCEFGYNREPVVVSGVESLVTWQPQSQQRLSLLRQGHTMGDLDGIVEGKEKV